MAEPQKPSKSTGMASNGKPISIDDIKAQPMLKEGNIKSEYATYEPDESVDYSDLSSVNKELTKLLIRFNRIRKEMRSAEREAARLRWDYEGKKKRILIGLSGGTEKTREAAAELMCEEEYSLYLVASAVAKEIAQHNRDLRAELDLLKEVSNNLRRIVDLM